MSVGWLPRVLISDGMKPTLHSLCCAPSCDTACVETTLQYDNVFTMPGSFVNSLITLCDQGGIPNLPDLKSGRDGHCSFAA